MAGPPQAGTLQSQKQVLVEFDHWVHERGGISCGYYFPQSLTRKNDPASVRLGVELFIDLDLFDFKGKKWTLARRARNLFERSCWSVRKEFSRQEFEDLLELYEKWRKSKGLVKLGFLLENFGRRTGRLRSERLHALYDDFEKPLAFVSFYEYRDLERRKNVYLDQMVFDPKASRLALSSLLVKLAEDLQAEGVERVNLGLCPFALSGEGKGLEKLFKVFYRWPVFYNSKGLYHFKKRFATSAEERYLYLDSKASAFRQTLELARVTISSRPGFQCEETTGRLSQ